MHDKNEVLGAGKKLAQNNQIKRSSARTPRFVPHLFVEFTIVFQRKYTWAPKTKKKEVQC